MDEVYLCDLLGIPYIAGGLVDQPDWWVERTILWKKQEGLAEKHKAKIASMKNK